MADPSTAPLSLADVETWLAAEVERRPRLRDTVLRKRAAFAVADALAELLGHAGTTADAAAAHPDIDGERLHAALQALPDTDPTLGWLVAVAAAFGYRFDLLFVGSAPLAQAQAQGAPDLATLTDAVWLRCTAVPASVPPLVAHVDRSDAAQWGREAHRFADDDRVAAAGFDTPLWQLLASADAAGGKLQLRFAPTPATAAEWPRRFAIGDVAMPSPQVFRTVAD